jgi:hypothetical protein
VQKIQESKRPEQEKRRFAGAVREYLAIHPLDVGFEKDSKYGEINLNKSFRQERTHCMIPTEAT